MKFHGLRRCRENSMVCYPKIREEIVDSLLTYPENLPRTATRRGGIKSGMILPERLLPQPLIYRFPKLPRKRYGSLPVSTRIRSSLSLSALFRVLVLNEGLGNEKLATQLGGGKSDKMLWGAKRC